MSQTTSAASAAVGLTVGIDAMVSQYTTVVGALSATASLILCLVLIVYNVKKIKTMKEEQE